MRSLPDIRTAALPLAATLFLILLTGGCGGGASSRASGLPRAGTFEKQLLAFASCMRTHGATGYPDPTFFQSADGLGAKISPGRLNPDSPAFMAASHACHTLLPNGGKPGTTGAGSPQQRARALKFADCMRSHGVPGFPDPAGDGAFDLPAATDPQAPQFQRAERDCRNVRPSSLTINQAPPGG